MPSSNGHDKRAVRAELARRLMGLAPKARLDALVEADDARALIRSIPAEDLYATIVDVGLADATEVVQLASPEQFRTFVDLAAWTRDRLRPSEVLTWLRAARGAETEDFLAKLRGLDLEVLELMLRELSVVHDLEENPDVNPEGVTVETPEGKYLVELRVEGPEAAALRQLLNDLVAENPFEATRLLEAIRWEVPSELEETAYRFRSARLADLGFPTLEEAVKLFTYVDPRKVAPGSPSVAPGGGAGLEGPRARVDYVEAAFRGLTADERQNLEAEVRLLVNSALVAEAAEPGDPRAIRAVSEAARDSLSLGLEHLCAGDPTRAPELVRELHLKRIFQVGFSLTLELKFRVDRLAKQPLARIGDTWLLLAEEAAAIAALAKRRPLRALKVEGAEPVPFRSRRELAEAAAVIDRAERQRAVFAALLGGNLASAQERLARFGASLPELSPDRVFRAAVANAVLGVAVAAPVQKARLVELCERLFEGDAARPSLRASARERALGALSALVEPAAHGELQAMVERALNELLTELAPPYFTEGRLDPSAVTLPIADQPGV